MPGQKTGGSISFMKWQCLIDCPSSLAVNMTNAHRLRLLLITACLSLVTPAVQAQSRAEKIEDIDQRLQRVERVLDQSLLGLLQRIDAQQREIRQLRGEIESQIYEVETLKKRNRELYLDTDRRLTEIETNPGTLSAEGDFGGYDETSGGAGYDETASGVQLPVIVPENRQSGSSAGSDNGPVPPATPISGASTRAATQAEKASYTRAYDLLARGQNDAAVTSFDQFLREYPDGPYSDNAWYWQGEAKYAQREFDAALRNFSVVVRSFPNSPKVPDARLKIGFALFEQELFNDARQILTGVQNDYPGRSAAVLARKRLQQMDREGL